MERPRGPSKNSSKIKVPEVMIKENRSSDPSHINSNSINLSSTPIPETSTGTLISETPINGTLVSETPATTITDTLEEK
jgi:hypothetical protein